ncbi:TPA: hypothetical protein ACXDAZ_004127 [Clostridium botulinum]|uniref:hypothetical protein n=1 Tax=Clostridium botulinum TaxID=1491 RepID=UPI0008FC6618|nr:hypothetical protein [Clostridium botulinum]APC79568.1 hypothetical protein NPD2_241 [Clostridium botulinum]MCS4449352.1 hypothetical protein [Clostridium botulinum]MCS4459162.1 hypothetical protein [Clostridium botulinum]MCS4463297.1 hypothetical protein [Clostridium botulinum]MCS4514033.1 hypothetical protein [Clostridium botulinum]
MLDNTAKISEIITALENMQGLNQKADLKSALIAKGINASDTDGVANLIAKLNSANLVLNGKRFITGKIYVSEIFAQCSSSNNSNSIDKQHFTKQLNCPFEIGLFAIDLHYYTFGNSNRLYSCIKDGFITSEFASYTQSGFSEGNGGHFNTSYTKILDTTVNLDWYISYMYRDDTKHSYFNWIAIEK